MDDAVRRPALVKEGTPQLIVTMQHHMSVKGPQIIGNQGLDKHITSKHTHYDDVIMGAMASQITITIVYSTVYSGADQRKHKRSV